MFSRQSLERRGGDRMTRNFELRHAIGTKLTGAVAKAHRLTAVCLEMLSVSALRNKFGSPRFSCVWRRRERLLARRVTDVFKGSVFVFGRAQLSRRETRDSR